MSCLQENGTNLILEDIPRITTPVALTRRKIKGAEMAIDCLRRAIQLTADIDAQTFAAWSEDWKETT